MSAQPSQSLDRRGFLFQLVPACSLVCLGAGSFPALAGTEQTEAGVHKFDAERDSKTTTRRRVTEQYRNLFEFIKTLQGEMDEKELIRLLNLYSAGVGQQVGRRQAANSPDTSFATFVSTFRPPRYANALTHKIVEDTEKVFELKVTECIWAAVFRDAGLGGEIGHAALCNMDYHWPPAFNPKFKMERSKTLMQGHDCCNHRYLDTT